MIKQAEHKTTHQIKKIELVHSGEDYFSRLRNIISNAQSELHLQTYIFDNSSTALEIIDLLKEAALRNVKIYVLLDSYGSSSLSKETINGLTSCGINIRFFSPLFSSNTFYLGRRLHHKVIVADGTTTLIGGINISDKYRGSSTQEAWLDYAIQVENRELAKALEQLCRSIYLKKRRNKIKPIFHIDESTSIRILQNDWLKRKKEISRAYIKAIRNSKNEIIIVGSYFFPGRRLKSALQNASKRGVKTKLILSGISDIPLIKRATSYLYASLLKNNIELYEWNKSVLHGKVAVIDKEWSTIGSFNLNYLSVYGSIEMNVGIRSSGFTEKVVTHLYQVIDQCEKITYETLETRNRFFTRVMNWVSYRIVRAALIIVTYMPYKRFWA
ncbi:MAG TPA: phospholipase D-like domain-containing protein [Bacteroidia bacterium]|nr:phospholipase D-like domain-containing protein [Bacteroidia bacterium]